MLLKTEFPAHLSEIFLTQLQFRGRFMTTHYARQLHSALGLTACSVFREN